MLTADMLIHSNAKGQGRCDARQYKALQYTDKKGVCSDLGIYMINYKMNPL